MKNRNSSPTATELIQAYVSGVGNIITMNRAKISADQTEAKLYDRLGNLGASNGVYITSSDIPLEAGEQFVKDSVNAHLSKIQAQQISNATIDEVATLEQATKKRFIGRKVTISRPSKNIDVIDAVMVDSKTGEYRTSKSTAKKVSGYIQDVSFENNLLILKPTFIASKLTPNRLAYQIYMLEIPTLSANVAITM